MVIQRGSEGNKTNTEIVEYVYHQQYIEETAKNIHISPRYYNDFVQECYLSLLRIPNPTLNTAWESNKIKFLTVRLVINTKKWDKFAKKYYRYDLHKAEVDLGKLEVKA